MRRQEKWRWHRRERRARSAAEFTLVEFLIVVAILSILAAMLLPALVRARQTAISVSCMSRLHQFYLCNITYGDDYRGWLHPNHGYGANCLDYQWLPLILYKYGYVKERDIFVCSGWPPKHWSVSAPAYCYAMRYFNIVNSHAIVDAVKVQHLTNKRAMFCDSITNPPMSESAGVQSEGWYVHPRHPQKSANICFNEGNVKSCQYSDASAALNYNNGLYFDYFKK